MWGVREEMPIAQAGRIVLAAVGSARSRAYRYFYSHESSGGTRTASAAGNRYIYLPWLYRGDCRAIGGAASRTDRSVGSHPAVRRWHGSLPWQYWCAASDDRGRAAARRARICQRWLSL